MPGAPFDGDLSMSAAAGTDVPRLRVLALGPQDAYPPTDGGKEGIFGALGAIARRARVTYAFPAGAASRPAPATTDGYAGIGVRAVPVPFEPVESIRLVLGATAALRPYKFEKYGSSAAVAAFDSAVPREPFDAIVCHHAHTVRLAERLARRRGWQIPVLLREHNLEYELVASYRDALHGAKRAIATLFATLTRREEQSIWARVASTAFLGDHDLASAWATGVKGRFVLAREGVPLPARRPVRRPSAQAPLLVLLNPRATQSVVNLRDFIHLFWAPLRERGRLASDVLQVTGVTTERLAELVGIDATRLGALGVVGLGFLPSLAPTLEGALALVSPTFVGGGIRKKVLEAMAHQLPVIATNLDIDCCDYFQRDVNILPMDDPDRFAEVVERLRADEAGWCAISARARGTVEEFANWDRYGEVIVDTLHDLVREQRGRS